MNGTIGKHATQLRHLATRVPVETATTALDHCETIGHAVADITDHPSVLDPARTATALLQTAVQQLLLLRELLTATADHHSGQPTPGPSPTAAIPVPRGPDGAHYPTESAWCAPRLPPRLGPDGTRAKTTGHIHHDHWPQPGDRRDTPIVSGTDPHWTRLAEHGLVEAGVHRRNARFLSTHVEIKVAAMMIATAQRRVELTVNHVPCPDRGPY
ncbi:DddA-like double-stranded DNA deaminase toxin [Actinokineospora diospyrosa]|uniref:SCP1.201-like deaminase n=1 Tax=Actinokineospora diospyrosa TaxID=103728 RepID=A0ABT1IEW0_9PSEU|nr:DddA-like double-stranded DNA deaminase toxin [Actinokineospora diospyrosa]MCP2270856.1 SCP1.201-like deaminase [Actinokineospora diospyrosa]